jgi:hypothetical protein
MGRRCRLDLLLLQLVDCLQPHRAADIAPGARKVPVIGTVPPTACPTIGGPTSRLRER